MMHSITSLQMLLNLLSRTRQVGKTQAAIELTKKCDGIMLCMSTGHAQRIKKEHGIEAYGVSEIDKCLGWLRPVVVDQDALIPLIQFARAEYQEKSEELSRRTKQLAHLQRIVSNDFKEMSVILTDPDPDIRAIFGG